MPFLSSQEETFKRTRFYNLFCKDFLLLLPIIVEAPDLIFKRFVSLFLFAKYLDKNLRFSSEIRKSHQSLETFVTIIYLELAKNL